MKLFSLFFIISTLYYIFNRERLLIKSTYRVYKNIFSVYFDILYYLIELFYVLWIIGLIFFNFKFGIIFIVLSLFRWFILKPNKEKIDYSFNILKIIVLLTYFIS